VTVGGMVTVVSVPFRFIESSDTMIDGSQSDCSKFR
jgi:hypothetical protein